MPLCHRGGKRTWPDRDSNPGSLAYRASTLPLSYRTTRSTGADRTVKVVPLELIEDQSCTFSTDRTWKTGCIQKKCMRGSRNFHERGSNENDIFWSQTRGGPTPQKSRNYLFLGKFFKFQGGGGSGPPVPPSGSAHEVGAFRADRTEKVGAFRAKKQKSKRGALGRHIPVLHSTGLL